MVEDKLTPEERLVYVLPTAAAELLQDGYSEDEAVEELMAKGFPEESARTVVQNLQQKRSEIVNQGLRTMAGGALICVIGLVITIGSYTLANDSDGGSYVVAWGAIIFGAIQFFRGWAQAGGN